MTDRATLEARLSALLKARASGVATVEFSAGNGSSRRVTYRSDQELAAAIADVERRLAALDGRIHTIRIHTSKGL